MALLIPGLPRRVSRSGCLRLLWTVLLLLTGLAATESSAQTAPSREYQIKAVFLFNFIQFVEWPATAFPGTDAPLRIGILGDDPFGQAMEATVRGETIRNRRLVIARSHRVEDLQDCHLLFICKSESRRLVEILTHLEGRPVLTVSESEGFARHGGVIAFYPDGKKVRFEINSGSAQQAGLKMSSQLLELGKIVAAETPGGGS